MKGILLAGGNGTRLHPMTSVVNKHLIPVYDKPMIYYSLATLMLSGIKEILLITGPKAEPEFRRLFGDGSQLGIKIEYAVQTKAAGIAEAFIIGADFLGQDDVMLVLGDNIFYGDSLPALFQKAVRENDGATIFGYRVADPRAYGVIEFGRGGKVLSIEEKPEHPKSDWAATGAYMYSNDVVEIAKTITPSARGELEITAINNAYVDQGRLKAVSIGRGATWLDTGTPQDLNEASNFVRLLELRQGLRIACLEEVALSMGYIGQKRLAALLENMPNSLYRAYLMKRNSELLEGGI